MDWLETHTGKAFNFLNPQPDEIDIEDIAHALSNMCRYGGQCSRFYSVAEHSVAVCELSGNSLAGLLHDASEAYIQDIVNPVKRRLTNYKELEDGIMLGIANKYGFNYPLPSEVKEADVIQLSTEARHLITSKGNTWDWEAIWGKPRPNRGGIIPRNLNPKQAKCL